MREAYISIWDDDNDGPEEMTMNTTKNQNSLFSVAASVPGFSAALSQMSLYCCHKQLFNPALGHVSVMLSQCLNIAVTMFQ